MVDQSCPSPQLLGSVLLLKWGPLIPRYVQSIIYLQAAAEELADDVLREASPDLIGALFLFHLCFFILRLHGIVVLITHNQLNAHFGRIWILLRQLFRHLLVILLLNTGVISNADRVRRLAPWCLFLILLWASIQVQSMERLQLVALGASSVHSSFWIVSACLQLASTTVLVIASYIHLLTTSISDIGAILLKQQLALWLIRVNGRYIDLIGTIVHLVHLNLRSLIVDNDVIICELVDHDLIPQILLFLLLLGRPCFVLPIHICLGCWCIVRRLEHLLTGYELCVRVSNVSIICIGVSSISPFHLTWIMKLKLRIISHVSLDLLLFILIPVCNIMTSEPWLIPFSLRRFWSLLHLILSTLILLIIHLPSVFVRHLLIIVHLNNFVT